MHDINTTRSHIQNLLQKIVCLSRISVYFQCICTPFCSYFVSVHYSVFQVCVHPCFLHVFVHCSVFFSRLCTHLFLVYASVHVWRLVCLVSMYSSFLTWFISCYVQDIHLKKTAKCFVLPVDYLSCAKFPCLTSLDCQFTTVFLIDYMKAAVNMLNTPLSGLFLFGRQLSRCLTIKH